MTASRRSIIPESNLVLPMPRDVVPPKAMGGLGDAVRFAQSLEIDESDQAAVNARAAVLAALLTLVKPSGISVVGDRADPSKRMVRLEFRDQVADVALDKIERLLPDLRRAFEQMPPRDVRPVAEDGPAG